MTENRLPLPPAPPPLAFIAPLLVVLTVIAFYFAFSSANLLAIIVVLVAPLLFVLLGNLSLCLAILVVLMGAHLYVPGFANELLLLDVFSGGVLVLLLGHQCVRKGARRRAGVPGGIVVALFALLLLTIYLRGFGLQQLGGRKMGGMTYIRIMQALLLYLLPKPAVLTTRQWRAAFIGYCLVAFLPSIADLVFMFSGGRIHHLYYLVQYDGGGAAATGMFMSGKGLLRLRRLPSIEILLLSLVLFPWRGNYKILIGGAGLLAVLLAGLTGYRVLLIAIMLFVGILLFIVSRRGRIRLALKVAAGAGVALLLLFLVASKLPLSLQRTVSWVPFIEVSHEAGESASVTTRWRIEVWRQALRMLPDYWLIGRGFAFEASGTSAIHNLVGLDRDQVGDAIIAHNYHNGPLGVLLDLGVFGLVLVLAMLAIGAVRYYRLTQHPWRDSYLAWLHKLVLAKFLTSFFVFLFIYGDTRIMLPDLLLTMVFLECMTDSLRKDGDAKTVLPVASNGAYLGRGSTQPRPPLPKNRPPGGRSCAEPRPKWALTKRHSPVASTET